MVVAEYAFVAPRYTLFPDRAQSVIGMSSYLAVGVTGIVLAKLDGTARGGIVITLREQLGVPVKLVGVGEQPDDLQPFTPENFVEAMMMSD